MCIKPNIMMILAAGRGVRMDYLTNDKPKPLIQVCGRTLLDRIVDQGVAAGIQNYVVNTCYKAEMIEASLKDRKEISVHFSREETALETGGGILNALPLLLPMGQNGFYVANADPLWIDKTVSVFDQLAAAWRPEDMDVLLALVPKTQAFGDVRDGNYFIENGRPRRQRPGERDIPYLFMGIQILHPRIFDQVSAGVFSVRDLYDKAEKKGRLGHIIYDGEWYHVGTPEALTDTETRIKGHV